MARKASRLALFCGVVKSKVRLTASVWAGVVPVPARLFSAPLKLMSSETRSPRAAISA
jgi:hypothetical protein